MKKDISKLILITDLDGTFLPASKEISKKDMESINKFISSGGNFTIATGRPIQSVRRYFNEVNLTLPVILYNGGMIFDHKNDKIVWRSELPAEARNIVSRVLKEFPKASAEILTYENVYALQLNDIEERHIRITRTDPVYCELNDIPDKWLKFLFAIEPDGILKIKDFVRTLNIENMDFVQSCRHFYEALPLNTSKGFALKKLKELLSLEDYTVIAVGDYHNDIEMLKLADVAFAPANAVEDVKEIADVVLTETNEESPISMVIDYIFSEYGKTI